MKKIIFLLTICLLFSCRKETDKIIPDNTNNGGNNGGGSNATVHLPFPHHTSYLGAAIKPNNYSQTDLDNQTKAFYDSWKAKYLINGCTTDQYYILFSNTVHTTSESIGYGMLIMAYMAGYDANAQKYFDGLYKYFKAHPSVNNKTLMAWKQITCNDSANDKQDSASDGDIDVAFALLLADKQWGSTGTTNYLTEAKTLLTAIMQDDINPSTWTVKLGDWAKPAEPNFYYGTRSSDFITSHFKAFATATNNPNWTNVTDKCYSLTTALQDQLTGLIPDFIINTNTTAAPAGQNYLEGVYDGNYYYNACRFPWRIGNDYLITGDTRAKAVVNKLNTWLATNTRGDVTKISNGYYLNGSNISDFNDATFLGPFAVGAMAGNNQQWLNNLYTAVLNTGVSNDYFADTIKILSMITISGNCWNP